MPSKKPMSPKICHHDSENVDWNIRPVTCDNGLRYIGKCDCGAKVAEEYHPTGDIYELK